MICIDQHLMLIESTRDDNMLKKIEYYYDEDHEKMDISDEKIYWDTQKNQFRVKFYCNECGKFIECRCFDSLFIARNQIESGMICYECGFLRCTEDMFAIDVIQLLEDNRKQLVSKFAFNLLEISDMEELLKLPSVKKLGLVKIEDMLEIFEEDDRENKVKEYADSLLTNEEKVTYFYDNYEEWADGESCNI